MKFIQLAGAFCGLIGFACAPVASSVPKLVAQTPRTGDTVVIDDARFDLRVQDSVAVVAEADYEAFEKKLDSDYRLVKFPKRDAKLSAFLETHAINEIEISSRIDRADVVVIFVLSEATLSKEKAEKIQLAWLRGEKGVLSFSVDEKKSSDEAWSVVKKNLASVVVAYREAKKGEGK